MINRKSAIKTIDVHDLPEPIVAAMQSMAQASRSQGTQTRRSTRAQVNDRPPSAGRLLTGTSRSEIYDDVV